MLGLSLQKNTKKIVFGAALALGLLFVFFLITPHTAHAQTAPTTGQTSGTTGTTPGATGTTGGNTSSNTNTNATTCSIQKVGWILCPVIETAGKVGDQTFELLANNFLQTEPELVSSSESGTKIAWELARNIANLMFIAVFLIVILSQVTGRGINNYGIKKLLPRLIIGAIAVNVSYYICQAMVDISNILGYELENFLVSIAKQVAPLGGVFPPETSIDINTSNGTLGTMAIAILAIGAAVWFLLPILTIGITAVVITCIVIVAILLMRKAFIVLLVVASPIAFVLYLLPNTEKYFSKWLNMFWQLLMVFPIVGVLFGGGQLASSIILVAGANTTSNCSSAATTCNTTNYNDGTGKCIQLPRWDGATATPSTNGTAQPQTAPGAKIANCTTGSTPFMLGLVAAGVAVAPMIAVWSVLKGALSAAGAIGGKVSGTIQSMGKGAQGALPDFKAADWATKRAKESATGAWQRSQARGLSGEGGAFDNFAGGFAGRNARRHERLERSKSAVERAAHDNVAHQLEGKGASEILSGLPEAARERAIRAADAAHRKTEAEEIQAETLAIAHLDETALEAKGNQLIADGKFNSPELAAILQQIAKIDQASFMRLGSNAIKNGGMNLASRTVSENMMSGFYGGGDKARVLAGQKGIDLTTMAAGNIAKGSMSSNNLAGLSNDQISALGSLVAADTTGNAVGYIEAAAAGLSADQKGQLSQSKKANLNNIMKNHKIV